MYSRGQNNFPFRFRFVSFDDRATEIKRPRVVGTLVQQSFHETIDERLNDDSERLNDSTTHIHVF